MADSGITCSGLAATVGVKSITYRWTVVPDSGALNLPYLAHDLVELWVGTVNNVASASKVVDIRQGSTYTHPGLTAGTTYYAWVRAKNVSGRYGDYHPAATSGVSAVAGATVGTGEIGPTQLATNAVTEIKIASSAVSETKVASAAITPTKTDIPALSDISADFGTVTAGTVNGALIRTGTSGRRVEMSSGHGALIAYDGSGNQIGRVGQQANNDAVFQGSEDVGSLGAVGSFAHTGSGEGVRGTSAGSGGTDGVGVFGTTSLGFAGVAGAGGTWSFYDSGGQGYGPFTGAHDGFIRKSDPADIGDALCSIEMIAKNGLSDTLVRLERSATARDRRVCGVLKTRLTTIPINSLAVFVDVQATHDRLRAALVEADGKINAAAEETATAASEEIKAEIEKRLGRKLADGEQPIETPIKRQRLFAQRIRLKTIEKHQQRFIAERERVRAEARASVKPVMRVDEAILAEFVKTYDYVTFNAIGEGQCNVCAENGPIEVGDLMVTSSQPGRLMRQDDDLVRSSTFGKATEAANSNAMIGCWYMCG